MFTCVRQRLKGIDINLISQTRRVSSHHKQASEGHVRQVLRSQERDCGCGEAAEFHFNRQRQARRRARYVNRQVVWNINLHVSVHKIKTQRAEVFKLPLVCICSGRWGTRTLDLTGVIRAL